MEKPCFMLYFKKLEKLKKLVSFLRRQSMDNITHEVRLAHWAEIVKQCQNRPEGMSASTWLKQNGIAIKNYYYWQRRVRNEVFDQVTSVATVESSKNEMTFSEVPAELIVSAKYFDGYKTIC